MTRDRRSAARAWRGLVKLARAIRGTRARAGGVAGAPRARRRRRPVRRAARPARCRPACGIAPAPTPPQRPSPALNFLLL